MMRRIAVVGDSLEHGGQVLPYAGPASLSVMQGVRSLSPVDRRTAKPAKARA